MSFVFLILIRRGQAIAEILDFSWTGAIPLWCEGLSDFGGRVLGCLGEVLRRFCDPPPGSWGLESARSMGFRSVLFQAF
jgi:hypothetical protein